MTYTVAIRFPDGRAVKAWQGRRTLDFYSKSIRQEAIEAGSADEAKQIAESMFRVRMQDRERYERESNGEATPDHDRRSAAERYLAGDDL